MKKRSKNFYTLEPRPSDRSGSKRTKVFWFFFQKRTACFLYRLRNQTLQNAQALLQQIQALPPERIAEIEDFVAFITAREEARSLTRTAAAVSTPAFAHIWDNPDDDAYNEL